MSDSAEPMPPLSAACSKPSCPLFLGTLCLSVTFALLDRTLSPRCHACEFRRFILRPGLFLVSTPVTVISIFGCVSLSEAEGIGCQICHINIRGIMALRHFADSINNHSIGDFRITLRLFTRYRLLRLPVGSGPVIFSISSCSGSLSILGTGGASVLLCSISGSCTFVLYIIAISTPFIVK